MYRKKFFAQIKIDIIALFIIVSLSSTSLAQVAIGSTTVNTNAVLWLNSPTKNQGLIIPVVSNKTAVTPVAGMILFDESDQKIYYHDGTAWIGPLGTSIGGSTYTAGTGISIVNNMITNTGDTNGLDDITTSSTAGGDLSGTFSNLQINASVINDAEVAASANIAGTKINSNFGIQNIITTGNVNASAANLNGNLSIGGNLSSLRGVTYNWPTAQSIGARVLQNDGSGNLMWATVGGSGDLLSTNNLSDVTNAVTSRGNLGLGFLATLSTVTTSEIANSTILDSDISTSAAIAGTKVNPAFGALNISTTGTLTTGAATVSGLIIGASVWPTNATGVLTNNGTGTLSWAPSAGLSSTLNSTNIFVGNASNVATGVAMSGDATISNTGALTIANNSINSTKILDGSIADADVSTLAAIAGTKINPSFGAQNISTTGSLSVGASTALNTVPYIWPNAQAVGTRVLQNDGVGNLTWASSTELSSTLNSANIFVGNASNLATGVAMSGDATISNTGALTLTNSVTTRTNLGLGALATASVVSGGATGTITDLTIDNNDIAASAAIAGTKINPAFGAQNISALGTLSISASTTGNAVDIVQGPSGDGLSVFANTTSAGTNIFAAGGNLGTFLVRGNGDVHVIGFTNSARLGVNTSSPNANLSVSGTASKTGGGSWAAFSDRRVKKDITEFKDGLSLITNIKPVRFRYNGLGGNTEDGKDYVGVIAQDVQSVAPYMVYSVHKKLRDTDATDTDLLMYDGSALTYILVNAIKEQQQIIDRLSTQENEQNKKIAEFKKEIFLLNEKQGHEIAILKKQMEEIKKILGLEAKKN